MWAKLASKNDLEELSSQIAVQQAKMGETLHGMKSKVEQLEIHITELQDQLEPVTQKIRSLRDELLTQIKIQTGELTLLKSKIEQIEQQDIIDIKKEIENNILGLKTLEKTMDEKIQIILSEISNKTQKRPVHKGDGITHIVQDGETLSGIAIAYGIPVNNLVRWNQLESADAIYVGQALILRDQSND